MKPQIASLCTGNSPGAESLVTRKPGSCWTAAGSQKRVTQVRGAPSAGESAHSAVSAVQAVTERATLPSFLDLGISNET